MPATATVLYPADSDATFDLDYYVKKHLPLAVEAWGKYGLTKWEVVQFTPGPDGKKLYSVAAILTFDTAENLQKALSSEDSGPVMADVKNFSNKNASILLGNVVASS